MNNLLKFVTEPTTDPYGLCDNYGSCAKLYRFEPKNPQECGGRLQYTCLPPVDIKIEIQPMGEHLHVRPEGHGSEAMFKFFLNPRHPDNIAANGGNPLYLRASDSKFKVPGFDATVNACRADVIEYLGQKLIVCRLDLWGGQTCEQVNCDEAIDQEGTLSLYGGDFAERDATIDNDVFVHTGPLQP